MIERRRLFVPNVEPGAADMAGLERFEQSRLIVDAAARRRDEQRALLHPLQCARVDHADGVLRARAMQRHDVGSREQVLQRYGLCAAPADLLFRQVRVGRQHGHAKGMGQRGDAGADVADPDNAQHFSADFVAHDVLARETQLMPETPVAFDDPPR